MATVNVRELIAESLMEMEQTGTFLSALEQAVLDKYDYIDTRDKAFYKRVLSGTVERKIRIDYILGLFSSTKINKMKPLVRAVLRSSIYQIIWMDSVPDSAVCNEAVRLISKRGLGGLKGFVNGVLRNICRNKDDIKYPDQKKEPVKYLSVIYSCPEWIVKKLQEDLGKEKTENMLEATMKEMPVTIRMRCDADEASGLIDEWQKNGISVKKHGGIKNAYSLKGLDGIAALKGFDEGAFVVQNFGSMMVAHLAGIRAGDTVMDVCAAPGGKSIHASDILFKLDKDNSGHVYSYDLTEDKCDRIRDNIERLGASNISVEAHDASVLIPDMREKADVVIADVPCSGIGVIGHKSDIKYRLKPEDIEALQKIQRGIIDTAVNYVKPGGRFVYSTCTVTKEENQMQREYIINTHGLIPEKINGENTDIQLIPGQDMSDGFYIAVFTKEK